MELCPKLMTQEFLPQHIDPSQSVAYLATKLDTWHDKLDRR